LFLSQRLILENFLKEIINDSEATELAIKTLVHKLGYVDQVSFCQKKTVDTGANNQHSMGAETKAL
jgi:hypothetical protein